MPPTAQRDEDRPLRVAIDARVHDGEYVGIQQTMRGLAEGLATLDGEDTYHFLVWEHHVWIESALRGPCRPLVVRDPDRGPFEYSSLGRRAPALAKSIAHMWEGRGRVLPAPDPAVEALAPDLIHFMQQRGFRTSRPNIFQPHDLQHEHLPEFFHPLQRAYRRVSYRAMARQADRVSVMTSAVRDEIVRHLAVKPSDVIVVPWGSVWSGPGSSALVPSIPGVPHRYVLFPAQSWPHKNHEGLVRALAVLRGQGCDVPVICTGPRNEHWTAVIELARSLRVDDLLVDLGLVTPEELQALYRGAVALVFPSTYEGWGLPVVEALALGVPVACSAITPLVEIAAGAARLFDPASPESIAGAVRVLWADESERRTLADAARARGAIFSWGRTAEMFRAHYRDVCGRRLSDRDAELLAAPAVV